MKKLAELNNEIITCTRCPRLTEYRQVVARQKKAAFRNEEYWGRPTPGFGDPEARVLLVGLAPAAHGTNRTGRMFTGDGSGGASGFLMRTLHECGYADRPESIDRNDGLTLHNAFITAVARCAPPENKPLPEELENCRPYLVRELHLLNNIRVIVALGGTAFDQTLRALRMMGAEIPRPKPKFSHGHEVSFGPDLPLLLGSYHPSRQNTQTGKLTPEMFRDIFRRAGEVAQGN